MIAYGVNQRGKKEILAVEPFGEESKETWLAFFNKLKARGATKIALLISDAHAGIKVAFTQSYRESWQRCKVHFMRNVLAHVSPRAKKEAAATLKEIWLQEKKEQALDKAKEWIPRYEKHFPDATETLKEGLEESLQFYYFPQISKAHISSTNVIERINKEVRHRSRVVGVFPSTEAYMRLMVSYLMEYTEDWEVERSYIQPDKLEEVMSIYEERLLKEAA